jgi:Zn-dependent protease/predicted transcriptional regulator
MTKSFRIGRLFGIEIEIDYTWFIVFVLLMVLVSTDILAKQLPGLALGTRWLVAAFTTVLFFASVLLHELSHSVVAKAQGLGISGITLFIFGGVSKMTDEPKSAGAEFKIAIAGPLMSLFLAVLCFGLRFAFRLAPSGAPFAVVFGWLGAMNGMLAVFNMLPGFPLDGGRVLRAGLWQSLANLAEATRIAATFGQGLGILMIVGGIFLFLISRDAGFLWLALIGWFLTQMAQSSYQQVVLRQALSGVPVTQAMTTQVQAVRGDITLDRVVNEYIMAYNHPAFPVLDGDRLLGLLCLSDIRRVAQERWSYVTAREAVPPLTEQYMIAPQADAWDALVRMTAENCGRLLVVEGGALRGIISRTDIMRLMRMRMQLGL